ncbi:hypothetical protein [Streptomyces sp. SID1034]|uniref:hypothetical protein n=1 Tax=Streptomyces sp. SID1034 TaxID=2690248 RepID=UPI00136C523B|nr:hypothetical protein [Streptomyces sp. SID1034]MYV89958.1 hypothetical protein [Streptomyces sp. SID1034]
MSVIASRTFRAACASLVAAALIATVAPAANAAQSTTAAEPTGSSEGLAVNLAAWGYTYEEAVEAFKDSDVVQVVWGELPPAGDGRIQKRGVSFGWYVYVTLSQSQARAIMFGSAATAAGIIGVITGGISGAVAAGVYSYIASLGSDNLNKCKKVEIRFIYAGKAAGGKCIK